MMASLVGEPSIKGSSEAMRMVLLNFCTIGITFTWGIEMTYCTPYLLNLGLTKSNTSLIWIAGPLSGLLVQPIVGVIADENTSKWGRRRPFMVIGAAIVAFCLFVLGFTRELVGLIVLDDEAAEAPTIALAVLSIYVLDFAINAVMSCARSLVVDTLPMEKQQAGAAWSSRMTALGHIIGYGAGAMDLPRLLGTGLGKTQFQQLTVISAAAVLSTTGITCWAVRESVLLSTKGSKPRSSFGIIRQIYNTIRNLPPRIRAICWAVFWSWIGWFPFLFYSTTWVGETYFRYDVPADSKQSKDALGQIGRIGSTSLVMESVITCLAAVVLPMLVRSPDKEPYTARPPPAVAGVLKKLHGAKPDLLTTWIFGHVVFAAAMSLAPFATGFRFATALVCVCGIPWAIAMWAPTALLGIEVNKLKKQQTYRRLSDENGDVGGDEVELTGLNDDDNEDEEAAADPDHHRHQHQNGNGAAHARSEGHGGGGAGSGELSGIYFGILNIYTTIPQFLATLISTVVFAVLEPGKSRELADDAEEVAPPKNGPNAIAVCFFIGAICAVVAAFATSKLRRL